MEFDTSAENRNRLVRVLLTAVLALVAVASFRRENRLVGTLATAAAVGVGYTAVGTGEQSGTVDDGTTVTASQTDDGVMRCAACTEPIVVGQSRRPNRENRIVHESCL